MKKALALVLSVALLACMLVACGDDTLDVNTYKSYTYTVENGDEIKIKLDTSDDYDISSDVPFVISCDGEELSQGTFIMAEYYEQFVHAVKADKKAEVLKTGTKRGNEYIFWCYDGTEYNFAILIKDSDTGIILGNLISEESAKECFNRMTITVED